MEKNQCCEVPEARGGQNGCTWLVPRVDIVDQDQQFVIIADVPGVAKEDLAVEVERGMLTIRGRCAPHTRGGSSAGGEGGRGYERRFRLSEGVDTESINAEVKDGVVSIVVPKRKELAPRKIPVKVLQ